MIRFALAACWRRAVGTARAALRCLSFLALLNAATALADDPAQLDLGRRIYEDGIGSDGHAIQAQTASGRVEEGAAVACMRCHRRSGMGAVEGMIRIPPVCGRALYAGTRLRDRVVMSMDGFRGRGWNQAHPPYDPVSLARSIEAGQNANGLTMMTMMPRFSLGAADFAALSAYLAQLSYDWSPGVDEHTVEFATVIAPGVEPRRKQAFLDTFHAAVEIKNSNTLPGHRHMINAAEMVMNIERSWNVQVWELQGPQDTWAAQLDALYHDHPVFALVSGLSDSGWAPMQALCDREHMPCWFPSVPLPPARQGAMDYGLYFHEGVRLEAHVLSAALADATVSPRHVLQIAGGQGSGAAAAAALEADLQAQPAFRKTRLQRVAAADDSGASLTGMQPDKLRASLAGTRAGDVLVLWLAPDELAALDGVQPPRGVHVYVSGVLAQGNQTAVPMAWREAVTWVYPYELPSRRIQNMATFHSWLALHHLALVDEVMQSEVFFAVNYLQFTMSEMLDNVYRDLLLERGQEMLRRRELARAEEETLMRMQGHPPAPAVAARSRLAEGALYGSDPHGPLAQTNTQRGLERQGTTIYPRLSLSIGQHYASKGAYLLGAADLASEHPPTAPGPLWIAPQVAADDVGSALTGDQRMPLAAGEITQDLHVPKAHGGTPGR